ncbi:syntaxin-22 isoform X2 [Elaeis guineensis]|uniref:Syntaxin-22 n=1 Tax=Elaeis guineensis var. tenera TaxID=51953 RepID=A0A6I9QG90_ELAGV|nr:syntaxin-22 [Elaeis guineensis]
MSFQDLEGASKPSMAPKTGISAVAAGIFQLNTAVAGFRRLVDAIGTSKNTSEHRQALQDARRRIGQLVKETSTKLKSLTDANRDENPSKRAEEAKLARDFQAAIHDFQKAQKLAEDREAAYAPSPSRCPLPTSSGAEENVKEDGDEEGRLLLWEQKRQEILSLDNEIAFNEAVIEEKDQGIKAINYDVEQVNEIYRDLAVLLHGQRVTIDDIDKHMEETSASTAQAKTELRKAPKNTRSRSLWCCWALVIFVIVLVILLLVLIMYQ